MTAGCRLHPVDETVTPAVPGGKAFTISARFLIPMALSLGFGILFATPVILILTPALYVIKYDLESIARYIFGLAPRDPNRRR